MQTHDKSSSNRATKSGPWRYAEERDGQKLLQGYGPKTAHEEQYKNRENMKTKPPQKNRIMHEKKWTEFV